MSIERLRWTNENELAIKSRKIIELHYIQKQNKKTEKNEKTKSFNTSNTRQSNYLILFLLFVSISSAGAKCNPIETIQTASHKNTLIHKTRLCIFWCHFLVDVQMRQYVVMRSQSAIISSMRCFTLLLFSFARFMRIIQTVSDIEVSVRLFFWFNFIIFIFVVLSLWHLSCIMHICWFVVVVVVIRLLADSWKCVRSSHVCTVAESSHWIVLKRFDAWQ